MQAQVHVVRDVAPFFWLVGTSQVICDHPIIADGCSHSCAPWSRPGAAASLREGLEELLAVKRLALRDAMREGTLSSTNLIENLIGRARELSRRVKHWRGGPMILRWTAAGASEPDHHFHRINAYRGMKSFVAALRAHDAELDAGATNGAVGIAA